MTSKSLYELKTNGGEGCCGYTRLTRQHSIVYRQFYSWRSLARVFPRLCLRSQALFWTMTSDVTPLCLALSQTTRKHSSQRIKSPPLFSKWLVRFPLTLQIPLPSYLLRVPSSSLFTMVAFTFIQAAAVATVFATMASASPYAQQPDLSQVGNTAETMTGNLPPKTPRRLYSPSRADTARKAKRSPMRRSVQECPDDSQYSESYCCSPDADNFDQCSMGPDCDVSGGREAYCCNTDSDANDFDCYPSDSFGPQERSYSIYTREVTQCPAGSPYSQNYCCDKNATDLYTQCSNGPDCDTASGERATFCCLPPDARQDSEDPDFPCEAAC